MQRIAAPKVPSPDSRYILTGTRVLNEKYKKEGALAKGETQTTRLTPLAVAVLVIAGLLVAVGTYLIFSGKLSKSKNSVTTEVEAKTNALPATVKSAAKPTTNSAPATSGVVKVTPPPPAPPAQPSTPPAAVPDKWTLDLKGVNIPDAPVAGRIHGNDFKPDNAWFSGGALSFRAGSQGAIETGVIISFGNVQPEVLAGKTINVTTDIEKGASVQLRWKEGSNVKKLSFSSGYALLIKFGSVANNKLAGQIYLCAPDVSKSYLAGKFTAGLPPKKK